MSQTDKSSQSKFPVDGLGSLKRSRAEDDQKACDQLGLWRDTTYWFPDGNVVILAGKVAFRLYHGILAAQSSVFDDMLDFPQPEGAPTIVGCPILELPDSDCDLRHIFSVIFPRPNVSGTDVSQQTVEFAHISAVIRMAHKYQFEDILMQALGVLESYYTNDHERWMARHTSPLKARPRDAIEAVILARLTNTPSILPTAFLQCSALGPTILKGYMRNGDTLVTLSQADTLICLQGRDLISKIDSNGLQALALTVSGNATCAHRSICRAHAFKFWAAATSGFPGYDRASLLPWTNVISLFEENKGPRLTFCKACWEKITSNPSLTRARDGTWLHLPMLFKVEYSREDSEDSFWKPEYASITTSNGSV